MKIIRVDFSKRGKELRILKKQRTKLKKWDKKDTRIQTLIRRSI